MALIDVSRLITIFQRLCHFAEEFTQEHRPEVVGALTALFLSDLEEGRKARENLEGEGGPEAVNVEHMIDSFLLRLRRTLGQLTLSETELLGAIKESASVRGLRDTVTVELRDLFGRARAETRTHFSREVSDAAGFPARILEDGSALLRQAKLVSWTLRKPDFDLGESPLPDSTVTKESILNFFEPKALELEVASAKAVRCRARVRGKQTKKNQEVEDFRTTYGLFINLIKSAFRLAGQTELARWVSLNQPRRTRSTASTDSTPADSTPAVPDPSPDVDPPFAPDSEPDTDQG